jgi:hypothetical protein
MNGSGLIAWRYASVPQQPESLERGRCDDGVDATTCCRQLERGWANAIQSGRVRMFLQEKARGQNGRSRVGRIRLLLCTRNVYSTCSWARLHNAARYYLPDSNNTRLHSNEDSKFCDAGPNWEIFQVPPPSLSREPNAVFSITCPWRHSLSSAKSLPIRWARNLARQ